MDLRNRSALVTGASRGLGEFLARELARAGARVVLVARGREELERVARAIRAEGGEAHALVADVGGRDDAHRIAGAAAALAGPVDLLVHNAGELGRTPLPLLLDTENEDFERTLQVNLLGPFRLTRAIAGPMVLRGGGLVLLITSDASVSAYPRWGMYGVSKAAADRLMAIWGEELAGTGVRFLALDPGEMNTRMHRDAIPEADPDTLGDPEAIAREIVSLIRSSGPGPAESRAVLAELAERRAS